MTGSRVTMAAMRILVVEDEPLIADAIKIGLEAEGFSVEATDRGDRASSWPRPTATKPSSWTSCCPG